MKQSTAQNRTAGAAPPGAPDTGGGAATSPSTTLTAEQMEIRRHGITGSELAAVVGISPWSSPIEVWERKLGLVPPVEVTAAMRRGIHLEAGICDWAAQELDVTMREVGTLVHPDHPIVIATPDREIIDPYHAAFEAKAPGRYTARDWGAEDDAIPHYYVPQVTWEAAVLGADVTVVAALLNGDLVIYRVPFDGALFSDLLGIAQDFWDNHIVTQQPPLPDGTDAYSRFLGRRYARHDDSLVDADERIAQAMCRLSAVREQEAALKGERTELENTIKAAIGEAQGVRSDEHVATWKLTRGRLSTDWRGLSEALGATDEQIAAHTTTGTGTRRFLLKGG